MKLVDLIIHGTPTDGHLRTVFPVYRGYVVCYRYAVRFFDWHDRGEMTEWTKVHDWKSCVPQGTVGSNPTLSAIFLFRVLCGGLVLCNGGIRTVSGPDGSSTKGICHVPQTTRPP